MQRAEALEGAGHQAVELPHLQAMPRPHEVQRHGQAGPIRRCPAGLVLEQVPLTHFGDEQCMALQVGRLAIRIARHPHVARQHVAITLCTRVLVQNVNGQ